MSYTPAFPQKAFDASHIKIRQPALPDPTQEKARALPDSDFADNPDVIEAAKELQDVRQRFERFTAYPNKGGRIAQILTELHGKLKAARAKQQHAALDGFLDGDAAFTLYCDLTTEIARLEHQIAAAQSVRADIDKFNPQNIAVFRNMVSDAESRYKNTLHALKINVVKMQNQ